MRMTRMSGPGESAEVAIEIEDADGAAVGATTTDAGECTKWLRNTLVIELLRFFG
jgi:CO dehydrogenase/acetyl-CoA synthase gamma subunit (corrinoid Fe-S protein)